VAALGTLLLLPLFGFGRELGVPFLYWHDSAPVQAGVGTAMGLVYWHIGVVAYTLAAAKPGVIPETADDRAEVRRFVHVALLPLLIAALVAAISRCVWQRTFDGALPPHGGVPWAIGLALSYAITRALLRLSSDAHGRPWLERLQIRLHARLDVFTGWVLKLADKAASAVDRALAWLGFTKVRPSVQLAGLRVANDQRRRVFGLMMFFSAAMLLNWLLLSAATRTALLTRIPAALPYCLTIGMIAGLYGVARMVVRRFTLPGLGVVLVFCGYQYLQFPSGTAMPSNCQAAADPQACAKAWSDSRSFRERPAPNHERLISDDGALAAQLEREPGPIVIITTSGGGIRSAAWTVAIFDQLQQLDPEFFAHVRLVT